jgi:hypothetical protein
MKCNNIRKKSIKTNISYWSYRIRSQSFNRVQVLRSRWSLDQVGNIFSTLRQVGDEFLKEFVLFGTKLLNDVWEEIFDCFGLRLTTNNEGVVRDRGVC